MTYKEATLVAKTVVWTILVLLMFWFTWSYFDVLAHQMSGGTDNPLNLFRMLCGG